MQAFVHKIAHKHHLINALPVTDTCSPSNYESVVFNAPSRCCYEVCHHQAAASCEVTGMSARRTEQGLKGVLDKQVLQLVWASMHVPNDDCSALLQPV